MDLGLTGKVAMIAAATQGIGLAVARELASEGCNISICGRNSDKFSTALAVIGGHSVAYQCDVTSEESLSGWYAKTVNEFGTVDILVTNTGGPPAGSWQGMSDQQWREGIDSTLLNVVRQMRHVVPGMQEKGWGRIVHITSLVAKEPNLLLPISSTLRAGIAALTRLQATELAKDGITVNGVLPGHTLTDRQRHLAEIVAEKEGITEEEALAKRGAAVPMGRIAEPEEIAAAVAFLCSARASYITGVNLLVDGGATSGIA
ncbi:SDR family oxidoreductase [Kamptonema cortianum]|nr:SDR family oxidoreductase [Geitlerinema splendidum]MDK3162164.1 SDR family oxidoreductase [Kamptonema cortianum]